MKNWWHRLLWTLLLLGAALILQKAGSLALEAWYRFRISPWILLSFPGPVLFGALLAGEHLLGLRGRGALKVEWKRILLPGVPLLLAFTWMIWGGMLLPALGIRPGISILLFGDTVRTVCGVATGYVLVTSLYREKADTENWAEEVSQ